MTIYKAPTEEYMFLLEHICKYGEISSLPGYEDATLESVRELLPEAARFFEQEVAPSNQECDQQGSHAKDGEVTVPDAINKYHPQVVESGWLTLSANTEYGGSGYPNLVGLAITEMLQSSNVAYSLLSMLTQGVIHALDLYGSDEQKDTYLSKLVSGEWAGTMNLTENQAGSDLGLIKSKAVPNGDHYLISGQKIFITWGDQSMSENVIHLVLARTPDAPEGTKGISMFIVPKYLINEDGSMGERNDVTVVSTEHKMGIHASPTCVLQFGDNDGAIGYLVGEENKGLVYMFAMMNLARLGVGQQGISVSERSYQQALWYAKDRIQGSVAGKPAAIIAHDDVRRMLLTMRALTEASRAISFYAIGCEDRSVAGTTAEQKKAGHLLLDVVTPLVKAWSTEMSMEITSLGTQVHGGMGFIEETGACQHERDVRILPIYEGTNGIQALDFIGRKCLRDGGEGVRLLLSEMRSYAGDTSQWPALATAMEQCEQTLEFVLANPKAATAVAFDFMMLFSYAFAGTLMATSHAQASASDKSDLPFFQNKITTSAFYLRNLLPRTHAHFTAVMDAAELGDLDQWLKEM